ncbi:hypothetical protein GJ744_001615 [Endocarpon pusillum]|uniref:Uncharacterized protein n=1 Tax=Endocarpon pusillum TaxID=364733 RepID=A0A8H7DZC7_9EURO|nr:hypothetical protein GJ744_001615 [Endocarpon pusillum]
MAPSSQRYSRRFQDTSTGPPDVRANFPTLFAAMNMSGALVGSSRRMQESYEDGHIPIPRRLRSTGGSLVDGYVAIPRYSQSRKHRRHSDDEDEDVLLPMRKI